MKGTTHIHPFEKIFTPGEATNQHERIHTLSNPPHLLFNELQDFVDDRIEDFTAEEISGNGEFAVEQPDRGVVRVFDVETCEVEHHVCGCGCHVRDLAWEVEDGN